MRNLHTFFSLSFSLNEFVRHQNWDWMCELIDNLNAERHTNTMCMCIHEQHCKVSSNSFTSFPDVASIFGLCFLCLREGYTKVSNFREYKFYLNSKWKYASILWRVICMIFDCFLKILEHLEMIVKKWKKKNETQNHRFKKRTKYKKTHQFRMNNNVPNIKLMWTSNLNEWMNIIQNVNSSVSIEKHQSHSRFEL